jgi:hypothetical protein
MMLLRPVFVGADHSLQLGTVAQELAVEAEVVPQRVQLLLLRLELVTMVAARHQWRR